VWVCGDIVIFAEEVIIYRFVDILDNGVFPSTVGAIGIWSKYCVYFIVCKFFYFIFYSLVTEVIDEGRLIEISSLNKIQVILCE